MSTLLCSPIAESELTHTYELWLRAAIERATHKEAYSLIMKKASINTCLGQRLQRSSFSLLLNHYLSTPTQLHYTHCLQE